MVTKTGQSGLIVLLLLLTAFLIAVFYVPLPKTVTAQESVSMQVGITGQGPSISNVRCCWKDSDTGTYSDSDCATGVGSPYSITGGEPYDMMCNFTVTDGNGWQDMIDGWVNITWFNGDSGASWSSADDFDNHYINASCKNMSGTETGNDINFECSIPGLKHWADAGNWTLLVNSSDGATPGTPSTTSFRIANGTSIWQTPNINFGTMDLSATGSAPPSGGTGNADVDATTNNTGNTIINIEVEGGGDMTCTIGGPISVGSIEYDTDDNEPMGTACGQLTAGQAWDGDCTEFDLQDCSDACAAQPLDYTYWGITIPAGGVGGTCSLTVTVYGTQSP
jgi:hypothetical protein